MARKNYPGDLTDKEWSEIEPLMCEGVYRGAGCKGKYSKKEKLNAILYILRTGCQWSDLPHDFPPWKTIYSQFLRWRDRGIFEKINTALSRRLRILMGKNEDPSAGIIDSQSVKTTEKKGSAGLMGARKLRVGKDTYWLITLDY
jgi:transposase